MNARLTFIMSLHKLVLLGIGCLIVTTAVMSSSTASAGFLIDFEAPTYTGSVAPGTNIAGQDNWTSFPFIPGNLARVTTSGGGGLTTPLAGAQSMLVQPENEAHHPQAGAGFADGIVVSTLFQSTGGRTIMGICYDTGVNLTAFIRIGSLSGNFLFNDGNTLEVLQGGFNTGNVYLMQATINFTNQKYDLSYTDLTLNTAPTVITGLGFRNFSFSNITPGDAEISEFLTYSSSNAAFDNFTFGNPVPEPSSACLYLIGLIAALPIYVYKPWKC